MGFEYSHRPNGKAPTVQEFPAKSGQTDLSGGMLVNLESGEIDIAVSNDSALLGVVLGPSDPDEDITALSAGAMVEVITDPDAVYRVTDANARVAGASLDIAAGALAVTTDSNHDLRVVATSTSAQPTHVQISQANHAFAGS
jgi:hypothetical protein